MNNLFINSRYYKSNHINLEITGEIYSWVTELQRKIEIGDCELEILSQCILCGGNDFEVVATIDRYNFPVGTHICKKCGLIFRNPRLSQKYAEYFYNNYYTRIFKGDLTFDNYYFNQRKHAKFIYEFILDKLDKHGNIIEIGCGPGGILSFFSEIGFSVKGYDLDAAYTQWEFYNKPDIHVGGMKEAYTNKEKADLLILSHVLEHTFNPLEEIRLASEIVNEGGYIFIEVPGIRSFSEGHYSLSGTSDPHPYEKDILKEICIAHNYEFDLSTLSYFLNLVGFEIIKGTELIRILAIKKDSKIKSTNSLNENYSINRNYLLNLEKKRKLYKLSFIFFAKYLRKTLKNIIPKFILHYLKN